MVKTAIENKPIIFKYASYRLRGNKELAKLAVSKVGKAVLGYLTPELQKDEEILGLI